MCHHSQLCKLVLAGIDDNDNNQEEESDTNHNGENDLTFS